MQGRVDWIQGCRSRATLLMQPSPSNSSISLVDVNDGNWHMITVSTHPNNSLGYSLYLDGR